MAQYTARSNMRIAGREYRRGETVPMERLAPELRRKLIEQRRVTEDSVRVRTGRKER